MLCFILIFFFGCWFVFVVLFWLIVGSGVMLIYGGIVWG
jgi:hypothetical protein